MTEKLFYRSGSLEDFNQLKDLGIASYGQYAKNLTSENWERLNKFLHDENSLLDLLQNSSPFVCVDNSRIVGMAYLLSSGHPTEIYQQDWSYIRMVGVHPDYAGKGIAKKLTQLCIKKAKACNEKTIALHTSEFMDAARHIYESLGFKILKEIPPRYGKKYWLYTLELF